MDIYLFFASLIVINYNNIWCFI